jgi:hypothetical protein
MSDLINSNDFSERKKKNLDSLKEYLAMLAAAPGVLKTGLSGEDLAAELIKGALLLKAFIETGALPPIKEDSKE